MQTADLNSYTVEELQEMLAKKTEAQQKELNRKRRSYEHAREELLDRYGQEAESLYKRMLELKEEATNDLSGFRSLMLEYGDLRNGDKNKGNFEIKNERFKIVVSSQTLKTFDERAELAEAKIKEFLTGFVKKRDKEVFELVNALLERNETNGDFDIGLINRLYKMEDKYDDQNWIDGIRMFKEAYNPSGTAKYIRFFRKTSNGGWESLVLDFAKLKAVESAEKEEINAA